MVEMVAAGEGESSPPTSDRQEAKRPRHSSNPIKREAKQAVEAAPEGSKAIIRASERLLQALVGEGCPQRSAG